MTSPNLSDVLAAGAFAGSTIAAVLAKRTHRSVRIPDSSTASQELGEVVAEVATSQRELTRLVTAHIADDERFQGQVRDVLQLRRSGDRRRV